MTKHTTASMRDSWFRVFVCNVCKDTKPNYIADDTKFTDHSEMPYYTGLPYYVRKTYYVRAGTKE